MYNELPDVSTPHRPSRQEFGVTVKADASLQHAREHGFHSCNMIAKSRAMVLLSLLLVSEMINNENYFVITRQINERCLNAKSKIRN